MRSFIVTGASASGKTTLLNEAMRSGYINLSTHTTRGPREGEIEGIHNVFFNNKGFEDNFNDGCYLEPSLEYAEKNGVYYGTSLEWIKFLSRENHCAAPITPFIAKRICRAADVLWISLICNDTIRRERLSARGITEAEIEARLKTSKDQYDLPPSTMIFDTAILPPSEILTKITRL